MENSACLLNPNKATCRSRVRKNITHVACEGHLDEVYGNEMLLEKLDRETSYDFVGGFLRPSPGVVFKENTVIFPTRSFFDSFFRPEEKLTENESISDYIMNENIQAFVQSAVLRNDNSKYEKRFMVEMIRNLSSPDTTTGPEEIQRYLNTKAIAHLETKKALTESTIKTLSTAKHLNNIVIKTMDKGPIALSNLNISLSMKYILSNFLYTDQGYHLKQFKFVDFLTPNAQYHTGIGLVAIEEICHPLPIIIEGFTIGSKPHYNSIVASIKKNNSCAKIPTVKDLPSRYAYPEAFRSGEEVCFKT